MDISEFEYDSDREFAGDFNVKYEKLLKGSSAKVFLEKYKKEAQESGKIDREALAELYVNGVDKEAIEFIRSYLNLPGDSIGSSKKLSSTYRAILKNTKKK